MFELELPIGNGGTSYIDDESHPIHENMVICAKPGQIRHTRLPFKCYYIHMVVNNGYLMDILNSLPNYIDFSDTNPIKEIFISMCELNSTKIENDDILLQSLILKLIYLLNKSSTHVIQLTSKSNNHKTIDRTLEYINNNLSADLTLERVASMANFNAIYFHKLFKSSTGKTLHEYVEDQRIKKSINLLISTNMTLAQIAYECGFSSAYYFSRCFHLHEKISPKEYRQNNLML